MPQTDTDKLKAFVQKMHDQGAAGFAAGPWSIDESASAGRPAPRRTPAGHRTRHRQQPAANRTDRILGVVAMLSIATIIVGITGIYLTEESAQPAVAATDSRAIEALPRQPGSSQLKEIRQKLLLTNNRLDSLVAEFRRLKHRAGSATVADVRRLQTLEDRLVLTVTRLDRLSAEILDLKNLNNAILAATMNAAPPAATGIEARVPARYRTQGLPPAQASAAALRAEIPAQTPAEPVPAAEATASPAIEEPGLSTVTRPAPETVTGITGIIGPAAEPLPEAAIQTEPAPETVALAAPEPEAKAPDVTRPAAKPLPEAAVPTEPAPETVALAAPATGTAPAPASSAAGGWVINIASYRNRNTADRHVAELQHAGISAERVEASIKGGIMHRVRITGFASRSAARARAGALEQELDLPGIWIAKR